MRNHRPESTEEQLEHHSLPGTNMAGKGPAEECEPRGEHDERNDKTETEDVGETESR
jgi:hypothetical protein